MKFFVALCSLLIFSVACSSSSPKGKYEDKQAKAQEEYNEETKEAQEELKEDQKEEAEEYVEDSEEATINRDEQKVDVEE